MLKYLKIFSYLLFLMSLSAKSQDVAYAKKMVNELCSSNYFGRGYIKKGDKKAATFIVSELKKNNVKPFNKNYYQYFTFPVNTITGKLFVKLDTDTLQPGSEYLVSPSSAGIKGSYQIAYLNKASFQNKLKATTYFENKVIMLNPDGIEKEILNSAISNPFNAMAIIELQDNKLMQRMSQTRDNYTHLKVLKNAVDTNAKYASFNINAKFYPKYKSQNVIAFIPGKTDSMVVFTAHYDHLGGMGNSVYFPGANDNASGVSMLLNLSRDYAQNEKPKYTMAFIFFGAEEMGLVGSNYFAENPVFPLEKIRVLINLDLVGTGEDGIMIVNGKEFTKIYNTFVQINEQHNYLKKVKARPAAANSDHYFFYKKGVPSIFIYTMGGIAEYHNIYDKAETLPFTEYNDLFKLITDFVDQYE